MSKENEDRIQRDVCTPMLTAALFTIAKLWRQPKGVSTDEWMNTWYIHKMQNFTVMRKRETLPFATVWMDLEDIVLSAISQTEKDNLGMK